MDLVSDYGILSVLPVLTVIITAILTRRTVEPLLLGALLGYALLYRGSFFTEFLYGFTYIIAENSWFIMVFGFFGMVIALLEQSGGALGFAQFGIRIARTRTAAIMTTWILGILVFIDDYLNNLGVGTAMRSITDTHKVAREFLAFVINSTGASICVLVPVSSWGILMISIYDNLDLTVAGSSFQAYLHTIPYIIYAWAALLIVPFFAFNVIPLWGPMKRAEERAQKGQVKPGDASADQVQGYTDIPRTSLWNFILPLIALTAITLYTDDILIGMAFGFVTCLILYIPQRIMTPADIADHSIKGFKSMFLVTTIVLSAFLLQEANSQLGLTQFVIGTMEPLISPSVLPALVFVSCSLIAGFTGSFWGTMTIASPILIPLAISLGANPFLVGGAIVSAGTFGSHACFFGDAITLTSAVTGIKNIDYARTSIPLIIIPTLLSLVLFLVLGYTM